MSPVNNILYKFYKKFAYILTSECVWYHIHTFHSTTFCKSFVFKEQQWKICGVPETWPFNRFRNELWRRAKIPFTLPRESFRSLAVTRDRCTLHLRISVAPVGKRSPDRRRGTPRAHVTLTVNLYFPQLLYVRMIFITRTRVTFTPADQCIAIILHHRYTQMRLTLESFFFKWI